MIDQEIAKGLLIRLEQAVGYLEHPDVMELIDGMALPGSTFVRMCKEVIKEAKEAK